MRSSPMANNVQELYAVSEPSAGAHDSPAGPVLGYLADAWQALETSLPEGLDRWQADNLVTSREGIRHAWLALSNLNRRPNH